MDARLLKSENFAALLSIGILLKLFFDVLWWRRCVCVGSFFGHFDATISTFMALQWNVIIYFRSVHSSLAFRRRPRHRHSFVLIFYCFASHCVRISDQTRNDDKVQLLVLIKCRYLYWSCLMRLMCRYGKCMPNVVCCAHVISYPWQKNFHRIWAMRMCLRTSRPLP